MKQFKKGDRVKRLHRTGLLTVGGIYTVSDTLNGWLSLVEQPRPIYGFDPNYFELVEEQPAFNLHKSPWKIRTGSKEKSELVQKFLFENGVYWINAEDQTKVYQQGEGFLTNVTSCGQVYEGEFMYSSIYCNFDSHSAQEIVIEYETVIKNVVFPEAVKQKTEAEVELENLLSKIAELNKQAENLKADMEGK